MKGYSVASSKLAHTKTMVSWKIFVETVINNYKKEGFDYSHISQMNITTIAIKMDMTYDFYMKHQMHMIAWQINKLISKDKNLMNKLRRKWIHPPKRKFERCRV